MNQLEFSYEDYLHNLTKSCEKMETNFNSTSLDDDCLDQAPSSYTSKFMIEDASIDTNLNLSSSLSNTLSNTISSISSSSSIAPNDSYHSINSSQTLIASLYGDATYSSDLKLDLTKQLQKAKSTNDKNLEINSTKTKVPIKKRKVGVNHKFVNNPKHHKKSKQSQETFMMASPFQLLQTADLTNSKNESDKLTNDYYSPNATSSSKGMGCGKPGYITCSICNATKYYSHVQRRFGQFSCEPCSKFMKKFLKDPKVYYCVGNGECQIGKPSGEQEPRGVSVNRCKACWLKICLDKFVLEDETKEVIDSHYMPRLQKSDSSLNESRLSDSAAASHNLPPLPILNTRKRKTHDDALIEKYTANQHMMMTKDGERKMHSEAKSKRKHKDSSDDHSKAVDKRERKRKLIYSPPSTPKRTKKRFKLDQLRSGEEEDHSGDDLMHTVKSTDDQIHKTKSQRSTFLQDELNSSSESHPFSFVSNCINRQSTETSCSLSSDDQLNHHQNESSTNRDCGNCSNCLEAKNMNQSQIAQDTSTLKSGALNQSSLIDEFSSEDCIVDNCSELSYELAEHKQDDYLKDSFYDYTPAKTTEEEIGLKYIKNYEKQSTAKKESKFTKAGNKKAKKRKDILTNNLVRKSSLMKKNSFSYIFDADSSVIYEVLNANSPFL